MEKGRKGGGYGQNCPSFPSPLDSEQRGAGAGAADRRRRRSPARLVMTTARDRGNTERSSRGIDSPPHLGLGRLVEAALRRQRRAAVAALVAAQWSKGRGGRMAWWLGGRAEGDGCPFIGTGGEGGGRHGWHRGGGSRSASRWPARVRGVRNEAGRRPAWAAHKHQRHG